MNHARPTESRQRGRRATGSIQSVLETVWLASAHAGNEDDQPDGRVEQRRAQGGDGEDLEREHDLLHVAGVGDMSVGARVTTSAKMLKASRPQNSVSAKSTRDSSS